MNTAKNGKCPYFLLFVGVFAFVLVRTAWLCDDAFITFRVVDNFVHGYGLRWNVVERVQAYTNPLWMFVVSGVYFFTREIYFSTLVLSMLVSLAAVLVMTLGIATSRAGAAVAVTALTLSNAFVDYSTSGLENPLTHLLLAAFLVFFFHERTSGWRPLALGTIAALAIINRQDAALLFVPPLAYEAVRLRHLRPLALMALGFAPLVLWELFSVVYYGFPFPNTAYAKLGTGVSTGAFLRQGLWYYAFTLRHDPLTLAVCAAGLGAPLLARDRWRTGAVAVGMFFYLAYIVRIGGDFMGGRFFAAPFFVGALLVSRMETHRVWMWAAAFIAIGCLGFVSPTPTLLSGRACPDIDGVRKNDHGVNSERHLYYEGTGLLNAGRGKQMPASLFAAMGRRLRASGATGVHEIVPAGMTPFFAGPQVHFLDAMGLGDPLLARLPAESGDDMFPGHFVRSLPAGYRETLEGDQNLIEDKKIAALYDDLRVITREPLFTTHRFGCILRANLGRP